MNKQPLKVIAWTPDQPLKIGEIEIPCYVLEDETRVLSQGGFGRALGRRGGPKTGHNDVFKLPVFIGAKNLKPFVSNDLITSSQPIQFKAATGGIVATGYRATLLPQACEVYLAARDAGALLSSQNHIAAQAEILIRGLATVGIIALVDEATGYEHIKVRRNLAIILEQFIAKELQPWTKTFPYEFYEQIFRLKEWPGPDGVKRPSVIGHYTNDLVYERLAPRVLEELRKRNPVQLSGSRRNRHHQWFTPDIGHPKLKEHLAAVIALMRAAPNWIIFQRGLQRALPRLNETIPLALDD